MSIDASKLTVVATAPSAEAHEEDVLEQWNGLNTSVDAVMPSIRTFYADSLHSAILAWASESGPADLFTRIEQQASFVEQNVLKGYSGLTAHSMSLLGDYELVWDSAEAPVEEEAFRRWVYNLTVKPVEERPKSSSGSGKGLELLVEGKGAEDQGKEGLQCHRRPICIQFLKYCDRGSGLTALFGFTQRS